MPPVKDFVVHFGSLSLRRPKPNRTYWFVRQNGEGIDWCAFQCYSDGSAMTADLEYNTVFENAPNVWEQALQKLADDGYSLHADLLAAEAIDSEAKPPPELADFFGWADSGGT